MAAVLALPLETTAGHLIRRAQQIHTGRLASLDKSTTANIVERLQRRGWIRRGRDMRDGRRNLLSLTPTAKENLPEITARVEVVQDRLLQPLGPQLRRGFIKLLGQVAYHGPVPAPADDQDDRIAVLA